MLLSELIKECQKQLNENGDGPIEYDGEFWGYSHARMPEHAPIDGLMCFIDKDEKNPHYYLMDSFMIGEIS